MFKTHYLLMQEWKTLIIDKWSEEYAYELAKNISIDYWLDDLDVLFFKDIDEVNKFLLKEYVANW